MKEKSNFTTFTVDMIQGIKANLKEEGHPIADEQTITFWENEITVVQPTSPEKSEYIPTGALLEAVNSELRLIHGKNPHEIDVFQTDEYIKEKTITIETIKIKVKSTVPY